LSQFAYSIDAIQAREQGPKIGNLVR